jgi:signal transduction histidine kinase
LQILTQSNTLIDNNSIIKILDFVKETNWENIYADNSITEEELELPHLKNNFAELNIFLIFNSIISKEQPILTLLIDRKKSGTKYSFEDIELLKTLLDATNNALQKLKLKSDLIIKQNEAEKLKEISEMKSFFVSSVSHELKTPLTAIKLYAEFLNSNPNLSEQKKINYLKIIEGECDRLDRLINNVLGFSKIEKGTKTYQFEYVDLQKILNYFAHTFQYQLTIQNFELELIANPNTDYTIYADPDSMKEVFVNLLSNAIKYSFDEKDIKIKLENKDNHILVSVSDKGTGISSKDIDNIFTPFYRSPEKNISSLGGAGLGLAIVKNILDAHSAEIEVQSRVGYGTNFIIKFPKINEN